MRKLRRLTIGVINNYSYGEAIDSIDSSLKRNFNNQLELLKAINDKTVNIGIFDRGVKEYLMEKEGITNIFQIKGLEFIRPLYVIFKEEELRNKFNKGLEQVSYSL